MKDIMVEDGKPPDVKEKFVDYRYMYDEDNDGYTKEERAYYWAGFSKSKGFDVEGLMNKTNRPPFEGYESYYFKKPNDCPTDIVIFAKLGIHLYNMMKGENLQLNYVEKYNHGSDCVFHWTRFITCLATDPDYGIPQVFLTAVQQEAHHFQRICCFVARPKNEQQEKRVEPSNEEEQLEGYSYGDAILPEWPSAKALRDKTRYYSVKKSELLKHDWIRLYLELAFFHANWWLVNPDLNKLVILKVVVESTQKVLEPPAERLNAVNSFFYIKYKHPSNWAVPSLNPPRDRIAVIKRTLDKHSGRIILIFDQLYEEKLH